ncbi:DUF1178 family protein [Propylenella binzhouense]|uniref:DUF1178 family protein n=1 Tax=Propylenella binzhouense TaxID=2555902 RepID=A0A964T6N2_9HYPH|nr:DUF1178 family protein [Propylenella binzhouense]MYZ49531.1 DUF1178 family protein [Propylenella binzhouense]
MIRYALVCPDRHEFEAWFGSSDAYERQKAAGQVSCPFCGATDVEKALMAPALVAARKEPAPPPAQKPELSAEQKQRLEALRAFRTQLIANADYVGDRFAEEARKIHYEETEKRGIYGEATPEEARGLVEEGIAFAPLPVLPEDAN